MPLVDPSLTYEAKARAQFRVLADADFRVCSPLELRQMDAIHRRFLARRPLGTNQTTLLSKLVARLEASRESD